MLMTMELPGKDGDQESEDMDREEAEGEVTSGIIDEIGDENRKSNDHESYHTNQSSRDKPNPESKLSMLHKGRKDDIPKERPMTPRPRVTKLAARFSNVESDNLLSAIPDITGNEDKDNSETTESKTVGDSQPVKASDTEAHHPRSLQFKKGGDTGQGTNRGRGQKRGRGKNRNRRGRGGHSGEQSRARKKLPKTPNIDRSEKYGIQDDPAQGEHDSKSYPGSYDRPPQHNPQADLEKQREQEPHTRFTDHGNDEGIEDEQEEFFDAEAYNDNQIGFPENRVYSSDGSAYGRKFDEGMPMEYSDHKPTRSGYRGQAKRGDISLDPANRQSDPYPQRGSRNHTQSGYGGSFQHESHDYPLAHQPDVPDRYPQRSNTLPPDGMENPGSSSEVRTGPSKIEVYGFSASTDEEVLCMYFENKRKSGGGEVESIGMDPSKKCATITFTDPSVHDRVLKRKHTLAGTTLTVTEKKDKKPEENKPPISKIEVYGFAASTDEEVLWMYFENTRKSGGGDIENIDMDPSKKCATITFTDPSVLDRVLKRKHILAGTTLTVTEKKDKKPEEDEPPISKIEVYGFAASTDEEVLCMYFENKRKSGGGEIESIDMDPSKKCATITFTDPSIVDRVLKRTHTLAASTLTVKKRKVKPDEREGKDQTKQEEPERVIEVSGFKSDTSEDMLSMYFESTRRSGGGEVIDVQMNIAKNKAVIKFADQSVIGRVLEKNHTLEGAKLTVVEKIAQPPRPIDSHRIFLQGLPEDIHEETLMLFLENRTNIPEDPDIVYGEQPGTAMLYYEQEIQDLDRVITKFGDKKLKGTALTAEHVNITDCILVQGLASPTSKDMLELYFENQRKSGGGRVTDVEFHEDENSAVVYFEDWTTVSKVIERTHKLSGNNLTVTAHYECLGTSISKDGPVPVIPKPITYSVDPGIMDHILTKHSSSLAEEMMKYNTEVMRLENNDDNSQVLLKPVPIESDDSTIWRKWKETTNKKFSDFLQKFVTESIQVPTNIWADLYEILPKVEVGDVEVHQQGDKSTVTLIGLLADVNKAKAAVSEAIKELKIKAEREAQTTEKKLKLSPLKMKLFSAFALSTELNEMMPEVQMTVFADRNEIVFKGIRGEISESQVTMYGIFESLKNCIFTTNQNTLEFIEKNPDVINGLLLNKGLDAVCDVEEGKITIYGKKNSDVKNAVEVLRTELTSKRLPINGDATMRVLQSKKGSDKINSINEKEVVIMGIDSSKREVLVTGLTDKVDAAIAELGQFLEENVVVEKRVLVPPLQSRYISCFCGKELLDIHNMKSDVTIESFKSGFIVNGNEKGVDDVESMLENLKSKVVERKHRVDKPGIPGLLRDQKGQRTLQSIARNCDCVIDTQNNLDVEVDESGPSRYSPAATVSETLCHYTTAEGCRLVVCKGDLTTENVDAIINAANKDLRHIGGLARAIVKAGGETIQQESDDIIKKLGRPLTTSEAVCTGGGQLPCRHVIHVPGPVWQKGRRRGKSTTSTEENMLYDAVTNSLREAHVKKLKSVALPAISSGVYAFPLDLCAKTIVEASVDFVRQNQSSIREIRFTNITVEHSIAFHKALKTICGTDVVDGAPDSAGAKGSASRVLMDGMYSTPKVVAAEKTVIPASTPNTLFTKHTADTITTKEGMKIALKKGSIAAEQADVIVNTTAGEMDLSRGNVSKALLQAAGPGLQKECDDQVKQSDGTRQNVAAGDFIETGSANLQCQKVYHSHCPGYNQTDAVKVLQSMIKKLLVQAGKNGMTSIAVPAIGTGNLGFPKDVVARVMYEGVAQFSKDNPTSTLKDIRFWVYDKDLPTIQAFETEMQRLTNTTVAASPTVPKQAKKSKRKMKKSASAMSFTLEEPPEVDVPVAEETLPEAVYSTAGGSSEIKLGSVSVQLQQGDLVKENTDAIVNTVGKELSLKGVVSKALIRVGGSVIADECHKIRNASKSVPVIAMTTAGNLPSKHIIHVTLTGPEKVKKMTKEILQLAEKEGMTSIAFPALGTGNLGGSSHQVAPELIDAIGEFVTNENPTKLQLVKLVIFQKDMIPVFEETLKTKAGASFKKREGALTRGIKAAWKYATGGSEPKAAGNRHGHRTATVESEKEQDSITLYIVAGGNDKLDEAVKQIEEFIEEEFHSEELIPDGEVVEITEAILLEVKKIGQKHQVKVARKPGSKGVILEGAKVSVLGTKADIHTLFARIQAEEKRKATDMLLSKEVQWRYKTDAGIYDDYEQDINGIIERAHQDKKPFIDLAMEEGTIRIDFAKMVEIDLTGSKAEMDLHRADLKSESTSSVPDNWIPMAAGENLKIVPLTPGTTAYNQVEQTFRSGGYTQGTIVKIERIQQKELYTQYAARKESMKARLGRDTESTLYHGTSQDTVDKINMRGFNRSFCGKHAVAFGQGTYFARDVQYSAQDRYSERDANNQKYIYCCKVLVGDAEVGDSTIIVPHQKPNSHDIYDSTVDNVQNPSIVVIYHDAQAYPEYLITLT